MKNIKSIDFLFFFVGRLRSRKPLKIRIFKRNLIMKALDGLQEYVHQSKEKQYKI